jgi:crotonobetainyl-CoA:carnitine CoA-transferase CaiB-like acyl-CoA transferase
LTRRRLDAIERAAKSAVRMIPRTSWRPDAPTPLSDIRVLDLSRLVAGNMLTLQLADFGAEVVKIEDPAKGDPLRAWRVQGESLHWKVYARNKKSVAIGLRETAGRDALRALVAAADVLVENFRPGRLEAMGLGPDALLAVNPRLVIVRVSGFGQDGPYRERPGFGTMIEAMSGFAARNGEADGPPLLPPLALADMVAGLYGAFAVMVALRAAERNSAGQVIDLPLLDPMISILGPEAAAFRLTGQRPKRSGSRSQTALPRNVFATRDGGWIAISASMQAMAERLFRMIGRADMIDDPRFATNAARLRHAEECEAPVAAFIAARDQDEALAAFEQAEITAAPVYDIEQLLGDPHVGARGVLVEAPDGTLGGLAMHGIIPRLSRTPGALRHPAPALGADSRALLRPLLGEARFAALVAQGVIGTTEASA